MIGLTDRKFFNQVHITAIKNKNGDNQIVIDSNECGKSRKLQQASISPKVQGWK